MDLGEKLLKKLKEQRNCFFRLADGEKSIFNPGLYRSLEWDIFQIQKQIGKENKKKYLTKKKCDII